MSQNNNSNNYPLSSLHLPTLLQPINEDLEKVNQIIQQELSSEVVLIEQIGDYIINAGGKRLRPALLLLMVRAMQGNKESHTHAPLLAAVIEFIHTATLLHDDIVDESELRRGRKTANALFGNAASVLAGDFIYSRAFQMMVKTQNLEVMNILANTTNVIAQGEVLQLLNCGDSSVTEERYEKVIDYKTAELFSASTELASVLVCGHDEKIRTQASFYGRWLGKAFQVMDDWLDYAGNSDAMGKNNGDDLREGKPTLPLIYLLEHGSIEQKKWATQAINQSEDLTETQIQELFSAIHQSGALDYTLQKAQLFADYALIHLENMMKLKFPITYQQELESNTAYHSLVQLVQFAIQRQF